ncbi:MAG: S1C family serine protease [Pseudodesulfovibrio sp.]|uniref:S1C family serine protease n=1 Tax=Pseudodesulfovibrio sp. TaxID=2035812 RepID=UPI003D0C11C5
MRRCALLSCSLLLILSFLSGCQTLQGGAKGDYSFFYTPKDRVAELVAGQQYREADAEFARQREWFTANADDPEVAALLGTLSTGLRAEYGPGLEAATAAVKNLNWPAGQDQWAAVKSTLETLRQQVSQAGSAALFKEPDYRYAAIDEAERALKEQTDRIVQDAPQALARYLLAGGPRFFDVYPVELDEEAFLSEQKAIWTDRVKHSTGEELLKIHEEYGAILPADMKQELAEAYFRTLCPNAAKASLPVLLAAFAKTEKAGMELASVPGVKIAFLEVTSDTLKRKGVIEFPVAVKMDMPFEAVNGDLKKGFESPAVKDADIVIVFNLASTKTNRRVDTSNYVKSTCQVAIRQVPNPEWDVMQVELQQANTEILTSTAAKKDTSTADPWVNLGNAISNWGKDSEIEKAKGNIEDIKKKIRETPRYIDEPVFGPYRFQRVEMDVLKAGSVHYYIIDQRQKRYYSDFFDIQSKEFFTVCYDVQKTDPKYDEHMKTNVTEEYVDDFEKEPVTVKLSELLDQYAANKAKSKKYASLDTIREDVIKDRNVAVAAAQKESYGFDKRDDRRFESVVVVTASDGLGSGFYVTDDVVLTNYHVVEEQKFIEMKRFDKVETFGKVIGKDVRLDLALIKVQDRGRPVRFYRKKNVQIGETVEAIGHPEGLEFTLSRGVISTVRKAESANGVKGKPVLFIQTDTPINHGNSGGPLFLGNCVIGVNDWGLGKDYTEGLNFSIHYAEVCKFLDDNHIAYLKGE